MNVNSLISVSKLPAAAFNIVSLNNSLLSLSILIPPGKNKKLV
jgi:hypothetical protein